MKLSDLLKLRIKRRFQPIDYVEPVDGVMTKEERIIFKEECKIPPKPQPSKLLQELRDVMPEPPIHDYELFLDTSLFRAMLNQAQEGDVALAIDCESKFDEIILDEFGEWEVWLREQGIKTELYKGNDNEKVILLIWGEN